MRILVCGGRDYNDYKKVKEILDGYAITTIIHGAARGADTLGGRYGSELGIQVQEFPAQWNTYGKSAGAIRNTQMLEEGRPDCVVSFPGGRGTANMIRQAKEAGVEVVEVNG